MQIHLVKRWEQFDLSLHSLLWYVSSNVLIDTVDSHY